MFENLGDRLQGTFKKLRGQGRLTEDNIQDAMREVRMALLEADVALPVVKTFVGRGQLGPFANAYWGHSAYRLPPEANLMAVAHYLEALDRLL